MRDDIEFGFGLGIFLCSDRCDGWRFERSSRNLRSESNGQKIARQLETGPGNGTIAAAQKMPLP